MLVKLELRVGDKYVKGEFSPDMAKMIFNEIVKNGKEPIDKMDTPYGIMVRPTEPVKPVRYHRRPNKTFMTKYTDIFNAVSKDKEHFDIYDVIKAAGYKKAEDFAGTGYKYLTMIAKKNGWEKRGRKGWWKKEVSPRKLEIAPSIPDSIRKFKNEFKKMFLDAAKGREVFPIREIREAYHKTWGGYQYRLLDEITKELGYIRERGIIRKIRTKKTEPEKKSPILLIPIAKIEATVLTIAKSIKQFSVFDIMKAMGMTSATRNNKEYYRIWIVLDGMRKRGIIEKYSYVLNDTKRTFYSLRTKEPKPDENELPEDTTLNIVVGILDKFVSFDMNGLMAVTNKNGDNYQKYSAKALFDWIYKNTDYLQKLTGKKLERGGIGDFRFVKTV